MNYLIGALVVIGILVGVIMLMAKKWKGNKTGLIITSILIVLAGLIGYFRTITPNAITVAKVDIQNGWYISKNFGLKLKVPEGWEYKSRPKDKDMRLGMAKNLSATKAIDRFPMIAVGYEKFKKPKQYTIKQMMNIQVKDWRKQSEVYKNLIIESSKINPNTTYTSEGELIYQTDIVLDGASHKMKGKHVYIQKDDLFILIKFYSIEDDFNKYKNILDDFVNSLSFMHR